MSNSAIITTKTAAGARENNLGVYLHWNGGPKSVEAFLFYCKLQGYPAPERDCYGWARLCQVIGNFFGGQHSVGIDTMGHLGDAGLDNGVYMIQNWTVVDRAHAAGYTEQYDRLALLLEIDNAQPVTERLGTERICEAYREQYSVRESGDPV